MLDVGCNQTCIGGEERGLCAQFRNNLRLGKVVHYMWFGRGTYQGYGIHVAQTCTCP